MDIYAILILSLCICPKVIIFLISNFPKLGSRGKIINFPIGSSGRRCSQLTGNDVSWTLFSTFFSKLERACGVPVGRRSGDRLAMTLVATKNDIIFFFFLFFLCRLLFWYKECLDQKNLFCESWRECPKTSGWVDPFPDSVGHFDWIKKLI